MNRDQSDDEGNIKRRYLVVFEDFTPIALIIKWISGNPHFRDRNGPITVVLFVVSLINDAKSVLLVVLSVSKSRTVRSPNVVASL